MEITLVRTSLYDIPSKSRVQVIVHDGAADMQLWPGRGQDSDLKEAWGGGLQAALEIERNKLDERQLGIPEVIRVARGRLHADFLAWVATRPEEPGTEREPAPNEARIEEAVVAVLSFVAARNVERIAFGAMGAGPGEADRADRLVAVARGAQAYHEKCEREGRAPIVEEVLICEPLGEVYRRASYRLRGLAKAVAPEAAPAAEKKPARRRVAGSSGGRSRKKATPKLSADEVAQARSSAEPYSMRRRYAKDDWILHPKFGMGRVEDVVDAGKIRVLFEDGELRQMVHGRS